MPFATPARALVALALLCIATAAHAAPGYSIRVVALEGDPAPGTATTFSAPMDVALSEVGAVAFVAPLPSGLADGGAWLDPGSGALLRILTGDIAPATEGGSYLAIGGIVHVATDSRVATSALVTGGTTTSGLFSANAGGDAALVLGGEMAPPAIGGNLTAGLGDIGTFSMNAAGDVAFRSAVSGGIASHGVFTKSGGSSSLVAAVGDAAPATGGGSFSSFGNPSYGDTGTIVYPAAITGGTTAAGLFSGPTASATLLARAGDPAPGTGGGSFVDFLFPDVNASGNASFLASLTGSVATAGVFRIAGATLEAVALEHEVVAEAGGASIVSMNTIPAMLGNGAVAMSFSLTGGSVDGGVFLGDGAGDFTPVAVSGDPADGVVGATLESFAFLEANAAGQVAFVATLDDGRTGVFLATPTTSVPSLPLAWAPLAALGLLLAARRPR